MEAETDQGEREDLLHEAEVAEEPGRDTDEQHVFQTKAGRKDREEEHEDDFRKLVDRRECQRSRIAALHEHRNAQREEETARRDTSQQDREHEDEERRFLEERERFQTHDIAVRSAFGRGVRQRQRVNGKEEAAACCDVEELIRASAAEERLDEQHDGDPPHRTEHENSRRIVAIRDVLENDRVQQCDRRHVAHPHGDHRKKHRHEGLLSAGEAKQDTGEEVQEREHFLRGEVAVRQRSDEHRSENGADRDRCADPADVIAGKVQDAGNVAGQGEAVAAPDGELEEIRKRQTRIRGCHGGLFRHGRTPFLING